MKGADGVLHGTLVDGKTLQGYFYLPGSVVRVGQFEFTLTNDKRIDGTYTKPFDASSNGAKLDWWGVKK